MTNPNMHVVSLEPGYSATNLHKVQTGAKDPKDTVKIILTHVLEKTGNSPGYYSNEGELPW